MRQTGTTTISQPIAITQRARPDSPLSTSSTTARHRHQEHHAHKLYRCHGNDDGSSSSNDDGDEHHHHHDNGDVMETRSNFLSGNSFDALNSTMEGLAVGSLPSSRRERRMLVSTGGHEAMYVGSSGSYGHVHGHLRQRPGRNGGGGGVGGAANMAHSMPIPSAPFLSSRRDREIGARLSSMPKMRLPESATESIEPSSLPYGSLRESRFQKFISGAGGIGTSNNTVNEPNNRVRFSNGLGAAIANDESPRNSTGDNENIENLSSSFVASSGVRGSGGFFPHSLPARNKASDRDMIHERWEESIGGDRAGGIRGGAGIIFREEEKNSNHCVSIGSSGGGLGSLLNDAANVPPLSSSQSGIGIGASLMGSQLESGSNVSSNLSGLDAISSRYGQMSSADSEIGGGIGSALGTDMSFHGNNSSVGVSSSNQLVYSREETPFYEYHNDIGSSLADYDHNDTNQSLSKDGKHLASSLTGLNILESSRRSPGGLGISLTPAERESAIQRARSMSDDGTMGLRAISTKSNGVLPATHYGTQSPVESYTPSSGFYDDRPQSPHNPDTFGAFDFDMDE